MSNLPQDDRETRKVVEDFGRILRQKSKEEREALLRQASDEALAEELAEAREQSAREAAALREELAYDPAKERDRARETAKSAALLLIMLLLILLLIAAATGRTDILPIPGVQVTQTLRPYLNGTETGEFQSNVFVPTVAPGQSPTPDAFFLPYINRLNDRGSECSIGDPVSPAYFSQGLRYQWFQRALLKEMPAGFTSDPDWYVQGELLGRQVTTAIPFPTAQPFLSEPSAYYFRETGYSVSTQFLEFWAKCDGLPLLGYPISDLVSEVLTPGQQPYQVQYFERGRLEYHQDDPNRQVQFGLLGLIKSKDKNFQANIVMPPQPGTPVSLPIITATPIPAAASPLPPAATALPVATSPPPAATAYPGP
ncbi:MAG: hypothetical protein M3R61_10655 [Chloroflexota bacterium]|nr:hypothetical protein [Chloroflexota bacterium]